MLLCDVLPPFLLPISASREAVLEAGTATHTPSVAAPSPSNLPLKLFALACSVSFPIWIWWEDPDGSPFEILGRVLVRALHEYLTLLCVFACGVLAAVLRRWRYGVDQREMTAQAPIPRLRFRLPRE